MSLKGCEGAVSRMIREPEYLLIMELYILCNPVAVGFIELLLRIKYGIPGHFVLKCLGIFYALKYEERRCEQISRRGI